MNAFDAAEYAEAAARAFDLALPEHCKPGVAANLERLAAMAQLVFDFPLPAVDSNDNVS